MKIARKHIVQAIETLYGQPDRSVLVHFKKYSIRATRTKTGFLIKYIHWRKA